MTTVKWKMTNGNCALARRRSALIVKLHRLHHTNAKGLRGFWDVLSIWELSGLVFDLIV
jgi:hypothetical protein